MTLGCVARTGDPGGTGQEEALAHGRAHVDRPVHLRPTPRRSGRGIGRAVKVVATGQAGHRVVARLAVVSYWLGLLRVGDRTRARTGYDGGGASVTSGLRPPRRPECS